jgi:Alanyl-tRNA synthetase
VRFTNGSQPGSWATIRSPVRAGLSPCCWTAESWRSFRPAQHGELVLDQTPFYAEAGGQVGDQGALYFESGEKAAAVESVYAPIKGLNVHRVHALGAIRQGDTLKAEVDRPSRAATMRNHTATHLLHAALRTVLGKHVKQAGSVVDPQRLRFDFSHYAPVTPDEIQEIERLVNEEILRGIPVNTDVMDIDKASPPAPWRCSARSTATRCAWFPWRASAANSAAALTLPTPARSDCARCSRRRYLGRCAPDRSRHRTRDRAAPGGDQSRAGRTDRTPESPAEDSGKTD